MTMIDAIVRCDDIIVVRCDNAIARSDDVIARCVQVA